MQYTLDSVTHAIECLKEKTNSKKVEYLPLVATLEEISYRENNHYYFGVITTGNNIDKITLNSFGIDFIEVDGNSQIVALFSWIQFERITGNTDFPQGQFRGFRLITENSTYIEPVYNQQL